MPIKARQGHKASAHAARARCAAAIRRRAWARLGHSQRMCQSVPVASPHTWYVAVGIDPSTMARTSVQTPSVTRAGEKGLTTFKDEAWTQSDERCWPNKRCMWHKS